VSADGKAVIMPPWPPQAGQRLALRDDLALVLAPNAGMMTEHGTNSYVLGRDSLVVIDPGPRDPRHLAALLGVIDGRKVDYIAVTHSHLDHSALAPDLRQMTGAPVVGFGAFPAGRSARMQALAATGMAAAGEGIDHDFTPDIALGDQAILTGDWGQIRAIHTPGHLGNHLCFHWQTADVLFSGDQVMGWATSLVSPPDGDLTDYLASCRKLQALSAARFYAGHGAPIDDPQARLRWLLAHRAERSAQILAALPATPATITAKIYQDIAPALHPAASRVVLAHLIDLIGKGKITAPPQISIDAMFAPAPPHKGDMK
jgi:glyoxylase-like metal-dependent hydrolase (beta-lactamase superfamily II)